MRKRRRRIIGLLPRLARGLWAWGVRAARHPQPLILGGLLLIALWGLWGYARRADAFRIRQVLLPQGSSLKVRASLLGANLWEVDLRRLADELKQQQPWLQGVRIIRQLPNAIRIELIPRTPVAQVWIDRWYPIDREGFVLPSGTGQPDDHLVRLVGIERSGTSLRVGKVNPDARLLLALRVLEKLRRTPASVSRRLAEINVADPRQIRFVLDGETEVRCGSELELDAHLARLQAARKAMVKQPLPVKYIDVRFRDPVIGQR